MPNRIFIFYFSNNPKAIFWAKKIELLIEKKYSFIKIDKINPQVIIALGGDGTILKATQEYQKKNPIIVGLNLGHIGFLSSERNPKNFLEAIDKIFSGKYRIVKKMMIEITVLRKNKKIFLAKALNEAIIQNLLGMVEIEVNINDHPVQYIRGTGVLTATATGSTAYNLSAHGPIVMPDIECMIITEIMDHNIPTPSMIVKSRENIIFKILSFRKKGLLKVSNTGENADVIIAVDGEKVFPLEKGDVIKVKKAPGFIRFAEFESAYFFKSLKEKFGFR